MLRLYFLGEQRVSHEAETGAPSLVSGRALEVLAFLVVNAGRPQERGKLAGLFWPGSADRQARTNLRRELHGLRQLPDVAGCIHLDGTALVWREGLGCASDVHDFRFLASLAARSGAGGEQDGLLRHGRDAMEAYAGELLPGLHSEWVLAARESMHRGCVELCDQVAAAATGVDPELAQAAARRRLQLEPLEEAGYQKLMELQTAAGDISAAVRTFHRCSAALEQELGVEPGPRTRALARDLLGRVPDERPAGGRDAMTLLPGVRSSNRPVGRESQLSLLQARWERACAGNPGLVVVTGDAGVGKTRLLAALMDTVADGNATTAYARCFDGAGSAPLSPVSTWLENAPFHLFDGAEGPHHAVVRMHAGPESPETSGPANGRHWAGAALAGAWRRRHFHEELVRAVLASARPALLVLDDLQWCDEETLDWLSVLFGTAPDSPVLVVAAARTEGPAAETRTPDALNALRNGGWVQQWVLAPLDAAHAAELAASILGREISGSEAALLHAATGGYPLHVAETARGMGGATMAEVLAGGADGAGVLRRRFDQCSTDARSAASLAAAFGRGFSLGTLAAAWPGSEQSLVWAVDELWRLRILREQHGGYDFSHDLLRDCAYALVSPPQRWQLHQALARALEARNSVNLDPVAAQLAEQWRSAGEADKAVHYFVRAGNAAMRIFANARAVAHYQAALNLLAGQDHGGDGAERELEVLLHLPQPLTALRGYASPQLHATLERITELAADAGRPRVAASAFLGLFAVAFVQGRTQQAHALAGRALLLAGDLPVLAGQAHFAIAGAATSLGRIDEALGHFSLALDSAPDEQSYILGTRIEVHARAWDAHAHWLAGDDGGALVLARESVDRATRAGHPYSLAVALAFRAVLFQMRMDPSGGAPGERARLGVLARELEELCARRSFAYYGDWGTILRGWAAGGMDGVEVIRGGIARLQASQAFARMPYWHSLLAQALAACGRHKEAAAVLDGAESAAVQRDDLWWLPEILRQQALLAGPAAAGSLLDRAGRLAVAQQGHMLADRVRQTAANAGRTPGF
ncbi:DNA-binding SARP family transcriptional activator/tetratricopeptide (TPR) repeat protein [Arthrobacter stackebrandtii]|uniref:DNA-binding SARP family transcriptional activator/tetratricopeptide (TPR) repeat protein n=1 Tax=Arthrobacter stackebrandtii TaxID=272161 RepID=A0ABS4Z2P9_9MICC|nr:DNA-binding SARP family transcriptional activator/tetratricopeptide (TPR) repeat protein [Arthrobacter stackebrandtii]